MNTIELAEDSILHTYNRYQLVLDRGEGVYLFDEKGNRYLDFVSGIGVYGLGAGVKEFNDKIKNQIDKITHVSNLFYNEPAAVAAARLKQISGMDRVFFTNSGTEAVEGAIKSALKYYYGKTGKNDGEIIAMNHSFHGRTCGSLAVTGKEAYRKPFQPLLGRVYFGEINDFSSVEKYISDRTCAIILETVQGEGGIYPAGEDFLRQLEAVCTDRDIPLILDEIQCGMGRTGYMFAYQEYNIHPDIVTCAKALGNGIPVGAFMVSNKIAEGSLCPGDHGTTYGGNPLAAAAVNAVLDYFEAHDLTAEVRKTSVILEKTLDVLAERYSGAVKGRRGKGLMQGLILSVKPGDVVGKAMEQGLITLTAGNDVLRLLPPLVIREEHIMEFEEKMSRTLEQFCSKYSYGKRD